MNISHINSIVEFRNSLVEKDSTSQGYSCNFFTNSFVSKGKTIRKNKKKNMKNNFKIINAKR
jgi:hypothetical protein